ncbi:hypothetical protein AGMMS49959_03850 [Planctomycetales bacterium]|nr:hypothetical protein AGMMS49959_03850 [Planctomycetales bacterium]
MKINTDNMRLQMAIGFFLLTGIVVTMLMVVFMTGGVRLGGDAYYVNVTMENIGDLKVGAPVKYGGVEIGKVKKIGIKDTDIEILAGINGEYNLQKDTTAKIGVAGLVGDAFLEFKRGAAREYLPKNGDPAQAPRLTGEPQGGMAEMMVQMQQLSGEIETTVKNINALIGKPEFRENIERTLANIENFTGKIAGLIGGAEKTLDRVEVAVDNVVEITVDAKKTMTAVNAFAGKLFADDRFAEELLTVADNLAALTKIFSDQKEVIAATLKNVGDATGDVARITGAIKPQTGILRLLSDEQAGADVAATIASLQRAARAIATVGLSDVIADKYIGDKIAEKWLTNHKGTPEQMARDWKAWMANQKDYNAQISGGARYPAAAYRGAPTVAAPEAVEVYYEPAGSPIIIAPNRSRPTTEQHPLQWLYER